MLSKNGTANNNISSIVNKDEVHPLMNSRPTVMML
jgi:hypothetical protein